MPLSPELKSEMTGVPLDTPHNTENDKSVTEPVNTTAPEADQMTLLLSIDSQLKHLNGNIPGQRQTIPGNRNPDFCEVLTKIDTAQTSIENLLSEQSKLLTAESEAGNSHLMTKLQTVLEKQERNDRQLAQVLRENANFQIQVRQGMQRDLDKMKEQLSGEQFNPLLKEIAAVYVEYQFLLADKSVPDQFRKNLLALFEQLEDVLSDYGAEVYRSETGSIRQPKICKIINKIPTGQQEYHNTIAVSRKPGVVRGRSVLHPEFVDVYVFDASLTEEASTMEEAEESNKSTACTADCEETADTAMDN